MNLTAAMPLLATRTLWMARVPPWPLTNQSSCEDMEAMRLGRPGARGVLWGKGRVWPRPHQPPTHVLASLGSCSMDRVLGTLDDGLAACSAAPLAVFDAASFDAGELVLPVIMRLLNTLVLLQIVLLYVQWCTSCSTVTKCNRRCMHWMPRLHTSQRRCDVTKVSATATQSCAQRQKQHFPQ